MISLTLSLILAAAPIPKSSGTYEGQIGVLVAQPEPEILLLRPNGDEVKRVPLKNIEGRPFAIRLARQAEFAVVTFQRPNVNTMDDYYIPLNGKEKPRRFWENDTTYTATICLASDGKTAFTSVIDEAASNLNQGILKFKHWKIDVKTGKKEKYDLDADYNILDLSQDPGDMILVSKRNKGMLEVSLVSMTTRKVVSTMTEVTGLPLLIANGKSVMIYSTNAQNGVFRNVISIRDFGSTDTKPAPVPNETGMMANIRSVGADNEHVAFSYVEGGNPFGGAAGETHIVTSNFKKNSAKVIYKSKAGETIQDFDWR
ncbi:MAG: hypothetical protein U0798_14155 [Gemmataceae bacterium]